MTVIWCRFDNRQNFRVSMDFKMNLPTFDSMGYGRFGQSNENPEMEDSLNSLGQIIESIQLSASDFAYCQSNEAVCAACNLPIYEQFMLRVQSQLFHEACAACNDCGILLAGRCFERDGQLYCRKHYSRKSCAGCQQEIKSTDMVYKLKSDLIFHVQCHLCCECGKQLAPGDQVLVDEERKTVSCASHFSNNSSDSTPSTSKENRALPPIPQYPFEMYAFGEMYAENGKFMKRRGPRTTIKNHQLDVLNRVFSTSPKPSKHVRAKLAQETGLSMRVIQVWMQNRRSKERRLKHLCNFLRHYEQEGVLPSGAQLAFQQNENGQSEFLLIDQLSNFHPSESQENNADNEESDQMD